jgi:predicted DNA-binding transcriptional regulator AlpA
MAAATADMKSPWIRRRELRLRVPFHDITVWRWIKDGKFPAPRHLGNTRTCVWSRAEVEEWERQRLAGGDS